MLPTEFGLTRSGRLLRCFCASPIASRIVGRLCHEPTMGPHARPRCAYAVRSVRLQPDCCGPHGWLVSSQPLIRATSLDCARDALSFVEGRKNTRRVTHIPG